MPELPSDIDTVIIGAGPSGLSCAIQCQKNNKPFLLIEKNNKILFSNYYRKVIKFN